MAMPVLRSRIGRGSVTRVVTAVGSSRMIAAANRAWAASDLSGPMSRARPSQLTHSIATTVTTAGGTHHHRISICPMMPSTTPGTGQQHASPEGGCSRPQEWCILVR